MVHYPAGQRPIKQTKRRTSNKVNYGSRGMSLEEKINKTNEYYLSHNLAVIHKKPTPIQVVHVDYPKRSSAKITEAYYRHASTTDYNGVYQGYYIDFEAKETTNKTSFPLANIPSHQQIHMKQCYEQGGIVFLLISFKAHRQIYLLSYEAFSKWINQADQQSIPYTYIEEHGYLCSEGYLPAVDYLAAVDSYLENKNNIR